MTLDGLFQNRRPDRVYPSPVTALRDYFYIPLELTPRDLHDSGQLANH
jgi:hypothetical protein